MGEVVRCGMWFLKEELKGHADGVDVECGDRGELRMIPKFSLEHLGG